MEVTALGSHLYVTLAFLERVLYPTEDSRSQLEKNVTQSLRYSSTRSANGSRQCFYQNGIEVLMIHLAMRCSGHRIHRAYSSIPWSVHGYA